MKRIAIVGGGPSGFMAAIAAAGDGRMKAERASLRPETHDVEVVIFDRGAPLATLLRTGGGRCNLANATYDARELAAAYPRGGKFLLSAYARFGAKKTMAWFEEHGLPLAVEGGGRVFPASRRASEVRDLLLALARQRGVRVLARHAVSRIVRRSGSFQLTVADLAAAPPAGRPRTARRTAPQGPHESVEAFDAVVIATGGDSTDPEGSGYRFARAFGHSITRMAPALTALVTAQQWPSQVSGLTLPDARIRARFQGKTVADERGSLLFTHRGISGPLAFRVSSRCAFLPYDGRQPLELALSIFPDDGPVELARRLDTALARHPRQSVSAVLRSLVPRSLASLVLEKERILPTRQAAQVSCDDRAALVRAFLEVPLTVTAAQREGEIVTAGGIELHLVEQRTMESRIVPRLFFCGEVLDIDGFTGGFNLQAAWTTGRLAGLGAREKLLKG
ncbi:MAG: aminoacetone oxidase family FAD-binding enzyme [Spirochaetes bacterium]|nr:aminoacetone oxidase family FAD-binding enzyme [Spirochaetota bacterium]